MTTAAEPPPAFVRMEIRTCRRCGFDYPRVPRTGRPHSYCPDCRGAQPEALPVTARAAAVSATTETRIDPTSPGYRLAADLTACRLAIEIARSALKLGRTAEALAALEQAEAPARAMT